VKLRYLGRSEFDRVRANALNRYEEASLTADMCRINALYAIMRAGSGHIGTTFSSLDVVTWLHLHELDPGGARADSDCPLYFSSKGHDAPGLYAVLTALGDLDFDLLHRLRRLGGLPGHPDVGTPSIATNTGSLGMGISKAKGLAEADRLRGRQRRIFVLTGDGELQEGQIWESLPGAVNRQLGQLTIIVDHNKIQSDTWVTDVSDLGDLEAKFAAFGWSVARCDGHDPMEIERALSAVGAVGNAPGIVIADTVKGRGVSFMESVEETDGMYKFHSGAPTCEAFEDAVEELVGRCNEHLSSRGAGALVLETVEIADREPPTGQRLIEAYGAALCDQATRNDRIIALDADLVLDTGLVPFSKRFPERFLECGIAEQDMVSQASGLALSGLLPIVHSFACFLAPRPSEQAYNSATERTRVVYVGSLAGVLPGGPGHSHQSVRDIALFGSIPGLVAAEPCCEQEVASLLEVCLNELHGTVYLRLVSVPVKVPFSLPEGYRPTPGRGCLLREGSDAIVLGYGPVLLGEAWRAAEQLAREDGPEIAVVNLPWLNVVDPTWLTEITETYPAIVLLDNHYPRGGQGDAVMTAAATAGLKPTYLHRAVAEIPVCGANEEVLRYHRLDAGSLAADIATFLRDRP
jgi:transketolase